MWVTIVLFFLILIISPSSEFENKSHKKILFVFVFVVNFMMFLIYFGGFQMLLLLQIFVGQDWRRDQCGLNQETFPECFSRLFLITCYFIASIVVFSLSGVLLLIRSYKKYFVVWRNFFLFIDSKEFWQTFFKKKTVICCINILIGNTNFERIGDSFWHESRNHRERHNLWTSHLGVLVLSSFWSHSNNSFVGILWGFSKIYSNLYHLPYQHSHSRITSSCALIIISSFMLFWKKQWEHPQLSSFSRSFSESLWCPNFWDVATLWWWNWKGRIQLHFWRQTKRQWQDIKAM